MPTRPPIHRPRSGRGSASDLAAAERAYDRRRLEDSETRRLYNTARWRALRAGQLSASPVCVMCDAEGVTEAATVCDHVEPHRGDVEAFWRGPFQSLCRHHHNAAKQREEAQARRGVV